jgi:Spy/CpxP family protein refolding chaperone
LVFLAGGASGALTFRLLRDHLHHVAAAPKDLPPAKEPTKEAVVQRFKSELNLTPDQTTQISVVLEDFSHYYESLQEQQTDIRATGRNRIVAILTPEQREKFERMMSQIAPQLTPNPK